MNCKICGRPIVILIRQGSGICCNMCEKIEKGELTTEQIIAFIAEVNPSRLKLAKEHLDAQQG